MATKKKKNFIISIVILDTNVTAEIDCAKINLRGIIFFNAKTLVVYKNMRDNYFKKFLKIL